MLITNYYIQDVLSLLLFLIGVYLFYSEFSIKTKQIYFIFLITQGLSILILNFKIKAYLGIFLFVSGFYFHQSILSGQSNKETLENSQSIFIKIFRCDPSLIKYFSYVGVALIVTELITIRYLFNGYLGDIDILGLVVGFFWIIYVYISPTYSNERDFLFLFLNFLYFILAIPALLESTSLATDSYFAAKSNWIEELITKPLVSILQLLGYYSFAEGNKVYYVSQESQTLHSVWIAPMCSGIYSIQVFVSALMSYLLVINGRLDYEALFLTLLGIIISYMANLSRLVIVILAGHYYGGSALYWTHKNLGWIIFTFWMLLFWWFLNLVSMRIEKAEQTTRF